MSLKSLFQRSKKFIREDVGASGIEYAIVAAMVAVIIIGFMGDIGESVGDIFETIKNELNAAETP